ncbi:MAG: exodeoxyribonuclease V subunit alpha, partial [Ardenticatenales bacterium]
MKDRVLAGYRAFLTAPSPLAALAAFDAFRILCVVREGPYGVGHLNRLAEQALAEAGLLQPARANYEGRPVLILRNDSHLGLFNGDIGILRPDEAGELRAYFPDSEGG